MGAACTVKAGHGPPAAGLAVCGGCATRTAHNLTFLADNVPLLALEPSVGPSAGHVQPSSRPPLRIGALSFTAVGGLVSTLGEWVWLLVDADRCQAPNYRLATSRKIAESLRLLAAHAGWLLADPDLAADFVNEIDHAAAELTTLLDPERTWDPLPGRWGCPIVDPETGPCPGELRQHRGRWLVRCRSCGTTWDGDLALERLGRLLGVDPEVTVAQAAALAKVTERTIYQWVRDGRLATISDQPVKIDTRDLAAALTARSLDVRAPIE